MDKCSFLRLQRALQRHAKPPISDGGRRPLAVGETESEWLRELIRDTLIPTDLDILSIIQKLSVGAGRPPSAREIIEKLHDMRGIHKSQFYERLSHLIEIGLIETVKFSYPRSYQLGNTVLSHGFLHLLEEKKCAHEKNAKALEHLIQVAKTEKTFSFVAILRDIVNTGRYEHK